MTECLNSVAKTEKKKSSTVEEVTRRHKIICEDITRILLLSFREYQRLCLQLFLESQNCTYKWWFSFAVFIFLFQRKRIICMGEVGFLFLCVCVCVSSQSEQEGQCQNSGPCSQSDFRKFVCALTIACIRSGLLLQLPHRSKEKVVHLFQKQKVRRGFSGFPSSR